jgi:hypothetical protein
MPTSGDFSGSASDPSGSANRGKLDIFAFCSPMVKFHAGPVKKEIEY